MLNEEKFPNAYRETYVILKNVNESYINMIPNDLIQYFKKNMNCKYKYTYNPEIEFKDNEMLRETKALLAYIFLNYWATEKQRKVIEAKFKEDIACAEKEKYSYENLFKKSQRKNTLQSNKNNQIEEKNTAMVKYKESFFEKIILKIKSFFINKK